MERDSRTRDGQRENEGEGAEEREKEREKEIAREREMESDRFSVSSGKWKSVCVCACMRVCHVTQVDTGDYMKLQTCDIRLQSLGTRRKQKKLASTHAKTCERARAHTHTYKPSLGAHHLKHASNLMLGLNIDPKIARPFLSTSKAPVAFVIL